jgi:hypothetical protein
MPDTISVARRQLLVQCADELKARLNAIVGVHVRAGSYAEARAAYEADLDRVWHWFEWFADGTPVTRQTPRGDVAVCALGIGASSTSGLSGALRNWCVAARKRAALPEPRP